MHPRRGLRPGGDGADPAAVRHGIEECGGHLRAARAVDAGEDHRLHRAVPAGAGKLPAQFLTPAISATSPGKNRPRSRSATLTRPISTGTSTSGPITAAKAAPWEMPKVATATAMASSKLLDAAVKESVAVCP